MTVRFLQSFPSNVLNASVKLVAGLALVAAMGSTATAQFLPFFGPRAVGGVSVDADGTVRTSTAEEQSGTLKLLRESALPTGKLGDGAELRMVSLRKLQDEIRSAVAENRQLSEDVLYLAGLQRVEYILVYPEQNDIVLAGPAEGWQVRADASVVGKHSGRPVLQLEDLLVAMQSVEDTQQAAISVSIEPTPEGQSRLDQLLSQVRLGPGIDPATLEPAMKQAFGPQEVKLTTVPTNSRMAHTLVAADYRMKRLAMGLEDSPVKQMPSYLQLIRNNTTQPRTQPRWWIACDYDAILHSDDHLAWKLTGKGIKAMTEDEYVSSAGIRTGSGKAGKQAQRWADMFTEHFDELCGLNAAFGDLRNVMDLNIVATVLTAHQLEQVAGCRLDLLRGETGDVKMPEWQIPKTISPECSFIRGSRSWTVTASGGVEINPWKEVSLKARADEQVKQVKTQAGYDGSRWWW
jgi:hypothetical protein